VTTSTTGPASVESLSGLGLRSGVFKDDESNALANLSFQNILGSGAFGEVSSAYSREFGMVAVKKVAACSDDEHASCVKEAQTLKELSNHGNVVMFFEVFFHLDHTYFVYELVSGDNLEYFIGSTVISFSIGLTIILGLAHGLAHIHAHGIVHGDVKPANIMVSGAHGHVKICDLGLGRKPLETFPG
jgi:serine/threonine-protein kinase